MTVKKCDRCGKVYDNRIQGYIISYADEKAYYTLNRFDKCDLCDSCFDMFKEWLNTTAVEVKQ